MTWKKWSVSQRSYRVAAVSLLLVTICPDLSVHSDLNLWGIANAEELPQPVAKPGWLGVGLRNLSEEDAKQSGLPGTVVSVRHVFKDSPAHAVGLKKGDLIVSIGDVSIQEGVKQFIAHVKSNPQGASISLVIQREGEQRNIGPIVLSKLPDKRSLVATEFVGRPLPNLELTELGDKPAPVVLTDKFAGKVIVLDCWATWCGPCKRAMPILEDLYARYEDQGLVMVGISQEEREVVERFANNRPVDYPMLHDEEGTISTELYVRSYPTFVVIDRTGKVSNVFTGLRGARKIEAAIKPLLAQ